MKRIVLLDDHFQVRQFPGCGLFNGGIGGRTIRGDRRGASLFINSPEELLKISEVLARLKPNQPPAA